MNLAHAAFEPSGSGPYPAIVAFHGWGSNALDLLAMAPYVAHGRLLALCPQGPLVVNRETIGGFAWFPLTSQLELRLADVESSLKQAEQFLDEALTRYPIDPNRLAVLGFSQGGVIAYGLALRRPERYAALVALSSWLPEQMLAWAENKEALSKLSVLVQHGSEDNLVPVERAREAVARLRTLGVQLVYREHGGGHEMSSRALQELSDYLYRTLVSPIITP